MCNPNNPTGAVVTAKEIKQLLDNIPKDMPVLIDEAYHHYVDDPAYGTAIPYVLEGRKVVVARTFSKIAALAAMRIGYSIAPADMVREMRIYASNSVNVLAKWGAVASLKDAAGQAEIKRMTIDNRTRTTKALEAWGYATIPSQTNFFMVNLGDRTVQPVIEEFRKKGILVGRPFPPMLNHLRVSVGTPEDMEKFMVAFKQIFPQKAASSGGQR
jgi:histidinol-phosphate/aromatic aminotransferase/cobyric acid decarboxylase-like protein